MPFAVVLPRSPSLGVTGRAGGLSPAAHSVKIVSRALNALFPFHFFGCQGRPLLGWFTVLWLSFCAVDSVWAAGRVRELVPGEPVPLQQFASYYGFSPPEMDERTATIRAEGMELVLELNSRRALVNGVVLWLHQPVLSGRRDWQISAVDVETVLDPLLRPQYALATAGYRRIVIDPGHGGSDPGAIGLMGTVEKELALALSLRVADLLRQAGNEVHLTRTDDRFISLSNRVVLARELQADLFVSIHFNAAQNREARGMETFVLAAAGQPSTGEAVNHPSPPSLPGNAFDASSQLLGFAIHRRVLAQTGNSDRGLKRARFYLLREAPCPTVLFEGAFLSNPEDARNVLRPEFMESMAHGLAEGILEYVGWVLRARLEKAL